MFKVLVKTKAHVETDCPKLNKVLVKTKAHIETTSVETVEETHKLNSWSDTPWARPGELWNAEFF